MSSLDRAAYARLYGPTTGDRVRLGDTDLWVEVDADDTEPGEEMLGGCGKTARQGALVTDRAPRDSALDMVVLGVLLLDPVLGIRKTSIGIADGRIVGVGRAGNPDVQDGVELVVDAHTAMVPGEGLIATPGAVDSHVHLSNADLVPAALSAGVTTLVGMGIGGVWDVGANPAPNLHTLMASWTGAPVNAAFLARGSSGSAELLERAVLAGAGGFKVHEDWGAGPDAVDTCLGVAEQADLPVALHTDTLNESGFLEDTLDAVGGRTVHAYHVEGGGGHPDLLRIVGRESVLTSSTTPTLPLTAATVRELGPMTMTVHRGHPDLPSDRTIAASRIREHAIAAENRLHDDGRHLDHQLGRARHGPDRRDRAPHLAARPRAGPPRRRDRPGRREQRAGPALPRQAHAQPGRRARARRARRLAAGRPARRHRAVVARLVRRGARAGDQVRVRRVGCGRVGVGLDAARSAPADARLPRGPRGCARPPVPPVRRRRVPRRPDRARPPCRSGRATPRSRDSRGLGAADMLLNTATPEVEIPGEPAPVRVDGREVPLHHAVDLPLTRLHHLA